MRAFICAYVDSNKEHYQKYAQESLRCVLAVTQSALMYMHASVGVFLRVSVCIHISMHP